MDVSATYPMIVAAGSSHQSFRRVSPVDGVERIWTLRKMGDLPFVATAGYGVVNVLGPWYGKLATNIVAVILLSGASIALARAYDKNRLASARHGSARHERLADGVDESA